MSASIIVLPMVRIERADERIPVQGRISARARSTLLRLAHENHGGDLAAVVSDLLEQCAAVAEEDR